MNQLVLAVALSYEGGHWKWQIMQDGVPFYEVYYDHPVDFDGGAVAMITIPLEASIGIVKEFSRIEQNMT